MPAAIAVIYALCDPDTEEIRYIGKTSNDLYQRLGVHIYRAKRAKGQLTHRMAWIRSLLSEGKRPLIHGLAFVTEENWREKERWWIQFCRETGVRLTNLTDGGDGISGYSHTQERREQVRQQMLGNQYGKGHKWTLEQRVKMMASRAKSFHLTGQRGSAHHKSKLTESDVLEIRDRFENGERQGVLAKECQVSHGTIWGITERRTWRHI